jgi:hypothetical protein
MKCCCIKFYPNRQDFKEELETKKISKIKKKDNKQDKSKNKGDSRFYETTNETRQIFERKQTIFYSFFEMLLHHAVLKIHDKPLLLR